MRGQMAQRYIRNAPFPVVPITLGVLNPPPAPHLGAQMLRVRLDRIPQLPIRTLHLGKDVGVQARIGRPYRNGVDARLLCGGCCGKLDFEAFGEHGEGIPGPDDGAVVFACCTCSSVRGIGAVGRVGDEDANRCGETGGECTEDGAGDGVERLEMSGDAGGVGRVDQVREQQKAEAWNRQQVVSAGKV